MVHGPFSIWSRFSILIHGRFFFLKVFKFIIVFVCDVDGCGICGCVFRSEDNLVKSVLSFHLYLGCQASWQTLVSSQPSCQPPVLSFPHIPEYSIILNLSLPRCGKVDPCQGSSVSHSPLDLSVCGPPLSSGSQKGQLAPASQEAPGSLWVGEMLSWVCCLLLISQLPSTTMNTDHSLPTSLLDTVWQTSLT